MQYASVDISSATTTTVVAAVAGKKIFVHGFFLVISGAVTPNTVTWRSGSTDISGPIINVNAAGGGDPIVLTSPTVSNGHGGNIPTLETAAGEALNIVTGAADQVSGYVVYEVE